MTVNKYHNKKTYCLTRHEHDSKFEANYCNRLLAMKSKGEIRSYEIQRSFELPVAGKVICIHIVDFVVVKSNGEGEVHEAKGYETDVWKLKRELFKAIYPTIPYIVIKSGGYKSWKKSKLFRKVMRNLQKKK